jgi:SAM-dependent methyltransferase
MITGVAAIIAANMLLSFLRWVFLVRVFGGVYKIRDLFFSYIGSFVAGPFTYLLRVLPFRDRLGLGFTVFLLDLCINSLAMVTVCFISTYAWLFILFILFINFIILLTILPSKGSGKPLSILNILSGVTFSFVYSVLVWFVTVKSTFMLGASEILFGGVLFWFYLLAFITACWYYYNRKYSAGGNHFDKLAKVYTKEIPEYIRRHFMGKKISLNTEFVSPYSDTVGLDIGCGQGWYLEEMRRLGYKVVGVDYSRIQLEEASCCADDSGYLGRGSIVDIPIKSESLGYVYSINTFHHLGSVRDQVRALGEIYRVLKPGGVCIIHEMCIQNPLFRFYMGYIFPLIKNIDVGTEIWLKGDEAFLSDKFLLEAKLYHTFLPDFLPKFMFRFCVAIEKFLEQISILKTFSAHICIILRKRS